MRRLTAGVLGASGVSSVGSSAEPPLSQAVPTTSPSPWKLSASAAIKETFDSNVYLRSVSPLADQASLVTTLAPQVSGSWSPSPLFSATLGYTPEFAFFHEEPSEDYAAHRIALGVAGKHERLAFDLANSLLGIDGNSEGPTWTGPGGAPAAGGIAIRDRRDATVARSNLKVTQSLGDWLIRAAGTYYLHDFQTRHSAAKGYQNYVDRNEFTGGVDVGGRAYNTDFLQPNLRNDWILSANGVVNCAATKRLNAELSYAFEDGLSQVPSTEGREFERHLVSLGLKYVFR